MKSGFENINNVVSGGCLKTKRFVMVFLLIGMNLFCTCDNIDEQNIQCNKAKQQNNDGTVDPEIE